MALTDEERAARQRIVAELTGEPVQETCPHVRTCEPVDADARLTAEADALLADLAAQRDDYLRSLGDGGVYGDGLTLWDQA